MSDRQELAETYRAWDDAELLRRFRGGGLTTQAHEVMAAELRARGIDPVGAVTAADADPVIEMHLLDEAFGEDAAACLAAHLEGSPVPGGTSFYIDAATIDLLAAKGANPSLLQALRESLGDSEGIGLVAPAPEAEGDAQFVHNPLRFHIREHRVNPLRSYSIDDERGTPRYDVAKTLALERYELLDSEGRCVARLHSRLLALGPCYVVTRDEHEVAVLRYLEETIERPGREPLELEAAITLPGNAVRRQGALVMTIRTKVWPTVVTVDIDRAEDPVELLAIAIGMLLVSEAAAKGRRK